MAEANQQTYKATNALYSVPGVASSIEGACAHWFRMHQALATFELVSKLSYETGERRTYLSRLPGTEFSETIVLWVKKAE